MTKLVGLELLDRQIVDLAGASVGKVDDVELRVGDDGVPHVAALLVSSQALAERLHPIENPGPIRIPWDLVAFCDSAITLSVRKELLNEPMLEQWLRVHIVSHIPGASDAGT